MKQTVLSSWVVIFVTVLTSGPALARADLSVYMTPGGEPAFQVLIGSLFLFVVALLSFSHSFHRREPHT